MTTYAFAPDGAIERTGARPSWLDNAGKPVSDAVLIQSGWLPVLDTDPQYDPDTQRLVGTAPVSDWVVHPDHVERSYEIVDLTPEEIAEREAQAAAEYNPIVYKSDIARRATEDEAEQLRGLLDQVSSQFWLLYMGVQHISLTAPEFALMRQSFIDLFGVERADQLLAPSVVTP